MRRSHARLLVAGTILICGAPACKRTPYEHSGLKVANGLDAATNTDSIAANNPLLQAVVAIGITTELGEATCTATFVSATTALTAAHCFEHNATDVTYHSLHGKFYAHPKFREPASNADLTTLKYDTAVVVFPPGSAPATAPLATKPAAVGDTFTLAGFGNNDNVQKTGSMTKRFGHNKVLEISSLGMLVYTGLDQNAEGGATGENIMTGSGDSGGPMFINGSLAATDRGRVHVGGKVFALGVNLFDAENLSFYQTVLAKGAEIPNLPTASGPIKAEGDSGLAQATKAQFGGGGVPCDGKPPSECGSPANGGAGKPNAGSPDSQPPQGGPPCGGRPPSECGLNNDGTPINPNALGPDGSQPPHGGPPCGGRPPSECGLNNDGTPINANVPKPDGSPSDGPTGGGIDPTPFGG